MNGEIRVTLFKVFPTARRTQNSHSSESLGVFQSVLEVFRVFHIIADKYFSGKGKVHERKETLTKISLGEKSHLPPFFVFYSRFTKRA